MILIINEYNKKLIELSNIPGIKIRIDTKWLLTHSMKDNMNISDIMIRILAIEEHYGKNNIGFKLYNKMQEIRVKGNKLIPQHQMFYEKEFKTLIKSFEENGFKNRNPIYLNENFELLDGAHRFACAIYFKIQSIPVTFNKRMIDMHPDYSKNWFCQVGLEDYIPIIEDKYAKILNEWVKKNGE